MAGELVIVLLHHLLALVQHVTVRVVSVATGISTDRDNAHLVALLQPRLILRSPLDHLVFNAVQAPVDVELLTSVTIAEDVDDGARPCRWLRVGRLARQRLLLLIAAALVFLVTILDVHHVQALLAEIDVFKLLLTGQYDVPTAIKLFLLLSVLLPGLQLFDLVLILLDLRLNRL